MKKINNFIIGIIMLITANAFCQTSYLLTFKGEDKSTSGSVTLDSIYIKNKTSGEEITITDTFIYLTLQSGISEKSWGVNTFSIYQNYENILGGQSSFNVRLPTNSNLVITAYDITGKELCNYQGNFCKGIHTFDFKFSTDGIYIISANNGAEIETIKTYKNGIGNSNNYRITLIGSRHNSFDPLKRKRTRGSIGFTPGDMLKYIGYSEGFRNDTINDSPTANKHYDFDMEKYFVCGDSFVDDRDSHTYKTIEIGAQCWMAENLAYLPSVSNYWDGSDTLAFYYVFDYNGTNVSAAKATSNYQIYGVLYNWPAVMKGASSSSSNPSGVQGICPDGFHLPSDAEWKDLEMHLGMSQSEADKSGYRGTSESGKLKETGTLHWNSPNWGATNSSGFTALPGGDRKTSGFYFMGSYAYFWSSTEGDSLNVWCRRLYRDRGDVFRYTFVKYSGFSVRCVRN